MKYLVVLRVAPLAFVHVVSYNGQYICLSAPRNKPQWPKPLFQHMAPPLGSYLQTDEVPSSSKSLPFQATASILVIIYVTTNKLSQSHLFFISGTKQTQYRFLLFACHFLNIKRIGVVMASGWTLTMIVPEDLHLIILNNEFLTPSFFTLGIQTPSENGNKRI